MKKILHLFIASLVAGALAACNNGQGKTGLTKPELSTQYAEISKENNDEQAPFQTEKAQDETTATTHRRQRKSGKGNESFNFLPTTPADAAAVLLKKAGYTTSYNTETKNPNWVAWHLTAEHTDGPYKRKGIEFHPDEDAPEPRVDTYDYMRSGFDRGHMCPAADNRWSEKAMEDCFLMTNMCPQIHSLNSGLWNTLEGQCRKWAQEYGDVYVVSGPIFLNEQHKKIGKNKVWVPEAFFKVVLCLSGKPKAIGFICRNRSAKGRKKTDFVNSIDEVERITGIDFFPALPDDIERTVEASADYSAW